METQDEKTKIKEIKGTPFHIVSHQSGEDEKHFVVLGMNRVSPLFETLEQAEIYTTRDNNWELICATIGVIAEKVFTDL